MLRKRIIIVGGGLAGLSCAIRLHESGAECLVLESSDEVGGRVRTDVRNGFLLDRGFQVFLSAYPEAGRLLDLKALGLRRFKPGALVFKDGKLRRLMDVFRCPRDFLGTALQPIGTFRDKLLVGKLRLQKGRAASRESAVGQDRATEDYLRGFGFSESMIDGFFRPFYGGIFLERDLRTSSRMFEFTFKMFTQGFATLPGKGMREIPRQLAARLPVGSIRLRAPVRSVAGRVVVMEDGEKLDADATVVATDAETAGRLVPELQKHATGWRSVTAIYFSATASPLNEAIIALNGGDDGLVNNVCVLSDVAPGYAPAGKALISVSVLGIPEVPNLEDAVRSELQSWFGSQAGAWEHLATYSIRCGLPEQPPSNEVGSRGGFQKFEGIWVCGDHCSSASIEGALVSGKRTAEAILAG